MFTESNSDMLRSLRAASASAVCVSGWPSCTPRLFRITLSRVRKFPRTTILPNLSSWSFDSVYFAAMRRAPITAGSYATSARGRPSPNSSSRS